MRRCLLVLALVAGCGYDFDSFLPSESVDDSGTAPVDSSTSSAETTPADDTAMAVDTTVDDTMMTVDTMMAVDTAMAVDTTVVDTAKPDTAMPDTFVADTADTATVACTDAEGKLFGGHCYFPITTADRYDLVRVACTSRGAHLVTITSAAEEAFVETIRPGRDRWIGLRRTTTMFTWITGETLSYTKWEPGEPNGSGECARLRATNVWADQNCNTNEEAICERE